MVMCPSLVCIPFSSRSACIFQVLCCRVVVQHRRSMVTYSSWLKIRPLRHLHDVKCSLAVDFIGNMTLVVCLKFACMHRVPCQVASVEEGIACSAPASPLHSAPAATAKCGPQPAGSQQQQQQPQRPLFPGGSRAAAERAPARNIFASFPGSFPSRQPQRGPGMCWVFLQVSL